MSREASSPEASIPDPSTTTTSPYIPVRRRRTWFMVLPLVALAGAATVSVAYAQRQAMGETPRGGAMAGFVARRLERILDRVNATPSQRGQIRAIWDGLRPQLRALRTQHGALRRQIVAAVTAPTINASEIEKLRQQSMAVADKTSSLFTQGIVSTAQVLTPEQRKLAQDQWTAQLGNHHGFAPPSE
jgi:Spy/CpxP family protein refolding chaperone